MPTYEVRACSAAEIFDDPRSAGLIAEYAEECGNALIGKPAPRRDMYENLEGSGLGHCFAAYEDGALCGFALIIVSVVPHYGLSCATPESLFVSREANCGAELMKAVEGYARRNGCANIFYSAPVFSRFDRMLSLRQREYRLTNRVYTKRLA
ncbi:MAG TPA: GNAT family N-acetyltransferase [Silvibacterium sp.]|nr:GNAT family N-acetyltransferase [Silvibacterium sp.]